MEFPNPVYYIAAIVNQWERVHMSALKKSMPYFITPYITFDLAEDRLATTR